MKRRFSDLATGKPVRSPFDGSGKGVSSFKSCLNKICLSLQKFSTAAVLMAVLAVISTPAAVYSASPAHGDKIINSARFYIAQSSDPATTAVSVTAVVRTPSTIEALTYAPVLSGAQTVNVHTTAYKSGSVSGPFINLPPPVPVGTTTPIDLSQPVPLTPATQVHQGEPLFIRLTDLDQNLDSTLLETVLVTVRNPANGDVEILRLTETTPDSGVFTGYLPTSGGAVTTYNGSISISTGNILNMNYVDIGDGRDTSATSVVVDPYGKVFDSSTGLLINGATITLINTATGLPAAVFGDDGVSTFPPTIISGGTVSDSGGKVYSFPQGEFRFPFVLPGSYQFQVTPPAGYGYPSTVDTSVIQTLPGSPFTIVTGSRGEIFVLNPGPAVRIDVPLDPASSALWLQKTANKDVAGQGDFISYRLTVTNNSTQIAAAGVRVTDTLPVGFRLRKGSVKLNGIAAADPVISSDGRTLTFNVGTLPAGASANIDYVVEVAAGTKLGDAINSAYAINVQGVRSNTARVTVRIRDDFMRTKSVIVGQVTTGACNEETGEGTKGLEGVRVYLEDGSFVISDKRGMFHFEGINAGLHVVQMDLDSLPGGYEAFACTQNTRFAGRAFSQFVETQGGTLWRADFHVHEKEKPIPPQPKGGEIILQLTNTVEKGAVTYKVSMRGSSPINTARLNIILPQGVLYTKDSSRMDGEKIADPTETENTWLIFKMDDQKADWSHEVTFQGTPSGKKDGILVTQAYIAAYDEGKADVLTPPAETVLQWDKNVEVFEMPDIVLRPRFPVRGAELNAEDRKKLDELAKSLSGLRTEKIQVTGYTDNMRIAPQNRIYFADNQALSMARAGSVGRYLMDKLQLPPEKLFIEGKGSENPIADNSTEAGRALNRRVEVRITSSRVADRSNLKVVKGASGERRTETGPAKKIKSAQPESLYVDGKFVFADADDEGQEINLSAAEKPQVSVKKESTGSPEVSAVEDSDIVIKESEGILYPADKDILVNKVESVRVCLNSGLTPRLLVDNKEVPADRIGFTMKDAKAGKTIYSYIGVDFGKTGKHTVLLQGIDPFGNARLNKSVSVKRSGEVVSIKLKSAKGNVADGKTPVKFVLELYDADGTLIPAATQLEVREGTLSPLKRPDLFAMAPMVGSYPAAQMDKEGNVLFNPVHNSGPYRVILGYNNIRIEAETYVQPQMRDWILVGMAEGTVAYNKLSGNMESFDSAGVDEDLYSDGRIAFFAKGQIKGKWLLTLAYDSAKTKENRGNGLFQTINPETYFTLYGDSTQQQYDAASTHKLYIKIEREQFYAMFGDFDTGLTITELSRYSRRMTGLKTELQGKNYEINAFASETEQAYTRDEFPGDGTSGIYRFSRNNIIIGSETITIEVRDRFRSEVIISSRTLNRFTDYSIDYDAGNVLFKEPIYSRDANFNPVMIVAEYETVSEGGKDYTYGGRAGVKLLDNKVKAGGTYIHEGQGERSSNLYGADASVNLDNNTKIRGEYAHSDYSAGAASRSGNAYLAEVSRNAQKYDAKAYVREQEEGFGVGQQPGSEAGTRKIGIEGAYRFNEKFNTSANVYRQYNLMTDATRDMAEGKFGYTEKQYGASIGFLYANDVLGDGSRHESSQITIGGRVLTLYDRLTMTVDHAQSIGSNDNSDFPTRTILGAELAVTKNLSLLAAQEFTWGSGADTQNTRIGMRASPWSGASLSSSVERQFNENDERVFANVGIKQSWKVNDAWQVDAGVERSQTVAKSGNYQFNTNVPPASGNVASSSGIHEDFTAFSGGATYQVKNLTWDNRVEFRLAQTEDKWGLMSGVIKEVDGNWAWSGRLQLFQTSSFIGVDTLKANLRHGLVYRPPDTRWIALNRFDFIIDRQSGGFGSDYDSWRLINNLMLNYHPQKELELSMHYGAKYVQEKIYDTDYSGFTDLIGAEGRYDITKDWDVSLFGSILHSWNTSVFDYSSGLSVGYNIAQNAWLSLGYNLFGFEDKDFSQANFTAQGPFVRFRFKFDQESVREAIRWMDGNNSVQTK